MLIVKAPETGGVPDDVEFANAANNDPRWISIVGRDLSADGTFYYSVKSTGVYCRPSCPSRLARPENVHFHPTYEDAERAGFRPCKRCKPNERIYSFGTTRGVSCSIVK